MGDRQFFWAVTNSRPPAFPTIGGLPPPFHSAMSRRPVFNAHMEARVDAVFDAIRADAAFVKLTEFADGLPIPGFPRRPMTLPEGT